MAMPENIELVSNLDASGLPQLCRKEHVFLEIDVVLREQIWVRFVITLDPSLRKPPPLGVARGPGSRVLMALCIQF